MNSDEIPDETGISAATLAQAITSDPGFEASLREAVDTPVPAGLAARILARHAITVSGARNMDAVIPLDTAARHKAANRPVHSTRWLALAASVLLIVGVMSIGYVNHDPGAAIGQRIVVALNDAMPRYDRMVVANEVDPNLQENLHTLMQTVGLKKVGDLGGLNYCEVKTINGKNSGVLVLPGSAGAITVIYLRDEKVKARSQIAGQAMEGVIWPDTGGSVAILGSKGETMLNDVEQRVRRSIQWL